MENRRSLVALLLIALFYAPSCGGAKVRSADNNDENDLGNESVSTEHLHTARALEEMGRHLEASVYFEAALDLGGRELQILPLLVVSQVRAGRLEAAKQNVQRLVQIAPHRDCVVELEELLSRLTP